MLKILPTGAALSTKVKYTFVFTFSSLYDETSFLWRLIDLNKFESNLSHCLSLLFSFSVDSYALSDRVRIWNAKGIAVQ